MIRIKSQFSGSDQKEAFRAALSKFNRITLIENLSKCSGSNNPFYVDFQIKDVYVIQMLEANGLSISKSLFSRKKKGEYTKFTKWEIHILKNIEISFLSYVRGVINKFKIKKIKDDKRSEKKARFDLCKNESRG